MLVPYSEATTYLCGGEAQAQLANQAVDLLGFPNEGEQVHHDGLEGLFRQAGILAHA